jgi:eukaryotic-like serine/threonine-protein kinase
VQAPARSFTVPKLQTAEFVWDSLGPTLARGSSAVVFQASVRGQAQALRCYIRNDASSRDRYSALDAYLAENDLSPYVCGTTWLDDAITVNRVTWPVLTMEWIDGRTLNEYVDFLVTNSNAAALTTLAARWRALVRMLQENEFAHGDLQHGNVMVDQEGRLRLVDFDGVWIPQLAGQSPPTEFGHPNYQHPLQHVWDRWLDTFSALVIYLSLIALAKDPALWLALYNSKNLLFAKNDFFPPFQTEAWKQLAALRDPQVDELSRRLQECCDPTWVATRSLEMTLDQQAVTPARQQIPAEQRWWERRLPPASGASPAPGAPPGTGVPPGPGVPSGPGAESGTGVPPGPGVSPGTGAVAGPAAAGSPSRPWSQRPPSAGQQAMPAAASVAATATAQAETARIAAGSLPAPPPLSTPLSTAGTGPMPQLSQTMAPPGETMWWRVPPSASAQARPGSAPRGQAPPGPAPRGYSAPRSPSPGSPPPSGYPSASGYPPSGSPPSGYAPSGAPSAGVPSSGSAPQGPAPYGSPSYGSAPYGSAPRGPFPPAPGAPPPGAPPGASSPGAPPGASSPGPSVSTPPARAAKPQPGPVVGAIALSLGIVLLVIGAASHAPIIVIGGLVAGAWGMWRLVTASGSRTKPPGPD